MANEGEVRGKASYYTNASVDPRWGGVTKGGEKFDETQMTAAVRPSEWNKLKGKRLRVTHEETGKSVEVRVNDTGGFGKYGRVLDLSKAAYAKLADVKTGVSNVRYEVLSESPVANAIKAKEKK